MLHALSAYSFTKRKEIWEYLHMSSSWSKLWTVDSPVGVTVLENKMGSRLIETYCHPQKNIKPKHATSSVQCSFACHFLNKTFKPKILYYLNKCLCFKKTFGTWRTSSSVWEFRGLPAIVFILSFRISATATYPSLLNCNLKSVALCRKIAVLKHLKNIQPNSVSWHWHQ